METIRDITDIKDTVDPVERRIHKGIKDLKSMDVILKQADKNLGLVPIRGDIYNAMVRNWLCEPSFTQVESIPYDKILHDIKQAFRRSERVSAEHKYVILQAAEANGDPAPFYAIPKIHKKTLGSRPITAQHSYMPSGMSKVLAEILNKYVQREVTIGRDSKTTVGRLERLTLPPDVVFLTYDVEACYPSIDLEDAFETLRESIPPLSY